MKNYLKTAVYLFILLVILFFPVELNFFPWQKQISESIFSGLIFWMAKAINYPLSHCDFSSDSASMYFLFNLLFDLALLLALLFRFNSKLSQKEEKLFAFIRTIATFYLSVILLKYGFNKIFKWQFYMPEPNILYTNTGQLGKDILYWTSMGTSWWYSFFAGIIEIIPALLILFRKTRVLGLMIALAVMINVFAINIGFDISVKLFSLFLIFIILVLLKPQLISLYDFLILRKKTSLQNENGFILFKSERLHKSLKPFLIAFCLIETGYPYISTMNFNDDRAPRPFLHGAYRPLNTSSLQLAPYTPAITFTRFFIHRNGFIIFQKPDGTMTDYRMNLDVPNHTLRCSGYFNEKFEFIYDYRPADSVLTLTLTNLNMFQRIEAKAIDWTKMPALNDRFDLNAGAHHWIVDDYGK